MNRKQFLSTASLGVLAAVLPKGVVLAGGKTEKISKDFKGQIKITAIKSYRFKKANYVKVETNQGISGWGESDGANKLMTGPYIEKELSQLILGKDPFDSEDIWYDAYLKGIEAGMSGIHPGSLAGIDNAIWDLKGKVLGVPSRKLMGGNGKEKIQVYASYGRHISGDKYRTPQEMAEIASGFVEEGYKAIKARLQIRQHRVNPFPDDSFEVIKAVREAIGDDIVLYVDFNNGYTPKEAINIGKKLHEHFNIAGLEEPVFQQDYQGLKQVVDALDIPVLAGEHEYSTWMMRDLIVQTNVEYINSDVNLTGITESKKIAAIAHAFGKQIMVHNAKPTLGTAAHLQLLGSITNAANFQEYAGKRWHQGYKPLFDLFENYFEFKDGFLYLNDEPGLGLIVNEKAMEKNKLD